MEPTKEAIATAEVLSDPDLAQQIRQGEREIEAGEGIALEEVLLQRNWRHRSPRASDEHDY